MARGPAACSHLVYPTSIAAGLHSSTQKIMQAALFRLVLTRDHFSLRVGMTGCLSVATVSPILTG